MIQILWRNKQTNKGMTMHIFKDTTNNKWKKNWYVFKFKKKISRNRWYFITNGMFLFYSCRHHSIQQYKNRNQFQTLAPQLAVISSTTNEKWTHFDISLQKYMCQSIETFSNRRRLVFYLQFFNLFRTLKHNSIGKCLNVKYWM